MKILALTAALALSLSACSSAPTSSDLSSADLSAGTPSGVSAQAVAPVLTGGTDLLGADPFAAFSLPQAPEVRTETVAVSGQRFTRAWRATSLQHVTNPWNVQLSAQTTAPVRRGDVLVLQFWARAVGSTGEAQTEFVMELADAPYSKVSNVGVHAGPTWTLYQVPFKVDRDFAAGEAAVRFRLGYDQQALELGGVVLKDYGSTRTISEFPTLGFTYQGREANAPWRAAADARIDRCRKADLKVRVLNAQGQPVSGAAVRLQMRQHAFKFGTEIAVERLFADKTYQAKALELYNQVVLGNALKWPVWEQPWYPRSLTPQALRLFRDHGIPVRGHNLVWPCDDSYCLPDDVPGLFGNPAALRARIDAHLQDILGATKGQLNEWDVVNEPSANKRLARVLGEDEIAVWLKRAKQLDPSAKMFLNDYGNLGEGTLDTEYKRIIARMQALNAPLEGIGLQGHFGWSLTPPDDLYARLNSFAAFGLPLEITEFDVDITDEQLQADYLRDAMTVAFSQPNVAGFMMWGFWQDQHWLPDAALYRTDWSIKPNGQAWLDLVKKRWWTDVRGSSSGSGQFAARGFLGEYLLTATLGQKTVNQPVKLNRASGEFTLRLP